jgi:hypothetical protein
MDAKGNGGTIMEVNQETNPEGESSYSYFGKGLQFLIQTPLFIIVGVIVIIWETINKLFQAIYQQGAQLTSQQGESRRAQSGPVGIKVPMMPIDNYSQLDVDGVIARLDGLSPTELGIVKNYEINHENRQSIVEAVERCLTGIH